jgi:hypothetical protein
MTPAKWSRILVIVGLVLMVAGAIDPLEGSLVILPGCGLAVLGGFLGRSRHRRLLLWAFILTAVGVGVMFGVSSVGGFGGNTGRSMWWALTILPYPVGWVMGLVGAIRRLIESRKGDIPAGPQPTSSEAT